jgi:DNA-binding NarL/FixJ family response regulator
VELRILLVDDNPEYRFLLKQFIERGTTFVVVAEAPDGEEAVRLALDLTPDVVVMDVMMPIMGGVEATREIKARNRRIRVIALTNSTDPSHAEDMWAAGVDGYFVKTDSVDRLLYQLDSIAQVARTNPFHALGGPVSPPSSSTAPLDI